MQPRTYLSPSPPSSPPLVKLYVRCDATQSRVPQPELRLTRTPSGLSWGGPSLKPTIQGNPAPTFETVVWCLISQAIHEAQSPISPFPTLPSPAGRIDEETHPNCICASAKHGGNTVTPLPLTVCFMHKRIVLALSHQHSVLPHPLFLLSTVAFPSASPAAFRSTGLPENPTHAISLAPTLCFWMKVPIFACADINKLLSLT